MTSGFDLSYDLLEAFGVDRGTIFCCRCRRLVKPSVKDLKQVTCQHCGAPHVYIRLVYQASEVYIRSDEHGSPFTYMSAAKAMLKIHEQIAAHVFDPKEWEPAAVSRGASSKRGRGLDGTAREGCGDRETFARDAR